ncbi:MAG: [FeFe] hydrogenase H-cluster radical SAM maturase HydE [Patescibacteria group bacterium]
MCLTLPAKVISSDGYRADILASGKKQKVKIGLSEKIQAGDWVLFTGDYLIKKITECEAQEIFNLLGSYKKAKPENLSPDLRNILESASQRDLKKEEIEYLLSLENESDLEAIYSEANIIRKASIKDHICVHGIIEFSNHCRNNCAYCGLRCDNRIVRYRMATEEIVESALQAVNEKGYKILVLQSGEDEYYTEERLIEIIKKIKEKCRAFIYLSIGERPRSVYENLKKTGANGVLYRFETSNPKIYKQLHENDSLSDRLENLKIMKKLGYVISTGMMVGLPGQTVSDLADDIIMMRELGTFMPSFGPFIPTLGTPLADEKNTGAEMILKIIATTRLAMPKARIPVTTAMETIGGEAFRQKAFMAGANSVMFNLTPDKYRENYSIYANKFFDREKRYEKWALFKGELSYQMLENELQIKI